MNRIYWWPLANSLCNSMRGAKDQLGHYIFRGVDIYAGTKGTAKNYPCIEITWDCEENIFVCRPTQGHVRLWVDVCLQNDSDNPSAPYELLYHLQTEIIDLLARWPQRIMKEMQIAAKVEVPAIVSDGDIQRPTCVCRINVDIEWRNSI